ncbi:MAG: hypothetical protein OEZ25_02500 [Candidatus Bathyarchaeota archaeon]|nr:hypothetical protein [Candidatus Bathyarchaeota archaeon]
MSEQTLIRNIDYNEYVEIIGTAHFTQRSLNDAYQAVRLTKPKDVAIELDWKRFRLLNMACATCPKREFCQGKCEFIGATEALGNVDANIWLIDMSEKEIRKRIRRNMTIKELVYPRHRVIFNLDENPVWLWERGFKDRVIENSKRRIENLRRFHPSIWRVLIDERNALMASRLAWIASKNLSNGNNKSKILTFVGAAHVEGIRDLLKRPTLIEEKLQKFHLPFTKPILIKRIEIR